MKETSLSEEMTKIFNYRWITAVTQYEITDALTEAVRRLKDAVNAASIKYDHEWQQYTRKKIDEIFGPKLTTQGIDSQGGVP